MEKVRILAAALGGLAVLQLVLYIQWSIHGALSLFYFDPRIGLFFWLDAVGIHGEKPMVLQWLSAVWLISVAVAMWFRPAALRVYVVAECLLGIPSLLFFAIVFIVNVGPTHGFSRGELTIPGLVFLGFTVLPLVAAVRLRRGGLTNAEGKRDAV